ncbi:type II toxin-antitoxin system RelE/ParE family toxin [Chryseobacterium sp. POE27]|uniref:type II toxin-antitoxin system RelE/ParE family toxin n=1 Tax=Chryseobacterium sp. POE27 TaxID=3138177 RepID=UPI0032196CB7
MFKIIWSHHAECDYIDILEYWINHNKSNKYSTKLINEVEKKEKLISKNPNIGSLSEIEGVRYVLIKIFLFITELIKILLKFSHSGTTEEALKNFSFE